MRKTIDDYPIYAAPELNKLSRLEKACLRFAEQSHAGDHREKEIDGEEVPYIRHCYLVHRLLKEIGVKDEKTLAVAFLHDVLEEDPEFKNIEPMEDRQARFQEKLFDALFYNSELNYIRNPDNDSIKNDIGRTCDLIAERVAQLTNPKKMSEGKRVYQADKIRTYTPENKLVKSADQLATVIEDLFILPHGGTERGINKAEKFAAKAWANAKVCAHEGSDQHRQLFAAVKIAASRIGQILSANEGQGSAEKIEKIRSASSITQIMSEGRKLLRQTATAAAIQSHLNLVHPAPSGIVSIGFVTDPNDIYDNDNNPKPQTIRSFKMIVSPNQPESSHANQTLQKMIELIETNRTPRNYVTVYQCEGAKDGKPGKFQTRKLKTYHPIPLIDFLAMAVVADAISYESQVELLERYAIEPTEFKDKVSLLRSNIQSAGLHSVAPKGGWRVHTSQTRKSRTR